MLVYGDVETEDTVGARQAAIADILTRMQAMPPGIERHGTLVSAFIATSELVQGLIDAEFHDHGRDVLSAIHEQGMECLSILAHSIAGSWWNGFEENGLPPAFLAALRSFDSSRTIRVKQAEGYAFYALYPESYLEAARASGLDARTQVIGIRSIGTGLSTLVAAALGAPPPVTLRPMGHPFRREVAVDPALAAMLTADRTRAFAIVDEGPGLSGSSFGAVADWLEAAGVPRERIVFFPSHQGPLGPQASPSHQERWSRASRHVRTMDDILLGGSPSHHLAAWARDLIGSPDGPLEDVSGGAWRWRRYGDEASWPASNVQQERRKFLVRSNGVPWLVKFAGLGEAGARKLRMARLLHEAGFAPDVAGYRHGFLVQRWHEDAPSLDQVSLDRTRLIDQVGAYLGFRNRQCPADGQPGASLDELRRMAVYNSGQALGDAAASGLERSLPDPGDLDRKVRRVWTDNRMPPCKWLVCGDHLLKADALDHSAAHDLIGHQDIGWDIAGAIVEFGLSNREGARLCTVVEREGGHPVSSELLPFLLVCYCAFQLGAHLMAASALGGEEAVRLRKAADRYGLILRQPDAVMRF
ncbi:hypothetical protein HPT29_003510 [Microvirga terrae]|uniref:Uncharacterized protein n=1 Tax=Microvirga terrae TaxID=2740529 RepID=A0ABY5RT80_9HYPH|nr:hypothetical protein [Microvirga terrae]UVF20233.1 hypothetical protein HPT29_003510 [Microvirga terrae]